ncbi:MAG: S24/S26 family peptidase [Candidatus Zipacnadales bacterium]
MNVVRQSQFTTRPAKTVSDGEKGECFRLIIEGQSMRPTFEPGDMIVVQPLGQEAPGPGTVVVVQSSNGPPAIHRIVARQRRTGDWLFVTKGDALNRLDAVIPQPFVLGYVVAVERGGVLHPIADCRPSWQIRLLAWGKLILYGRLRETHPLRSLLRALLRLGRQGG